SLVTKQVDSSKVREILIAVVKEIELIDNYGLEELHNKIEKLPEQLGVKVGAVYLPIRIAVLGKKATPPLFESLVVLGKSETLRRLRETVELLG
ncbi:MAG: hypothetical protein KDD53_13145, partial [Bdellovibrionales bacterium]|nr:hypothetical protein [Bdellovibrionales bacterium]